MVYTILHIAAHFGGGVGITALGYFREDKSFSHEVVILGYATDYVFETAKSPFERFTVEAAKAKLVVRIIVKVISKILMVSLLSELFKLEAT